MNGIAEAVQIAILIAQGVEAAVKVWRELQELILTAQAEGRDLTPEELQLSKQKRDEALAALDAAISTK